MSGAKTIAICLIILAAITGCNTTSPAARESFARKEQPTVRTEPIWREAQQSYNAGRKDRTLVIIDQLLNHPNLSTSDRKFLSNQKLLCQGKPLISLISAPTTLTGSSADCGPRALALLLDDMKCPVSAEKLGKLAGTNPKYGTRLDGLQRACEISGLKAQGVQMNDSALGAWKGQGIAWANGDHYVAVLGRKADQFRIHDPNMPPDLWSVDTLLRKSGGIILTVERKAGK